MTTRTDAHKPSAIEPADYEYVAQEYMKMEGLGDCQLMQQERERLRAHMARTGGTYSKHEHKGNCMCCGSPNAIYTVLFYHAKTNSYVRMGSTCALKLDMGNAADFRRLKKAVDDLRKAKAGKLKAQAILAEHNLTRAWDIYSAWGDMSKLTELNCTTTRRWRSDCRNCDQCHGNAHVKGPDGLWYSCQHCNGYGYFQLPEGQTVEREEIETTREALTVSDIVSRLVRYGNISDKQIDYLGKLLQQIETRKAREEKFAAERAAAKPCVTGRQTVEVEVIKTETRESQYGIQYKMTVKHADGWLAWGTHPAMTIEQGDHAYTYAAQRGDKIKLTATFTASDKDPKFAFFKRPIATLISKKED